MRDDLRFAYYLMGAARPRLDASLVNSSPRIVAGIIAVAQMPADSQLMRLRRDMVIVSSDGGQRVFPSGSLLIYTEKTAKIAIEVAEIEQT